MGISHLPSQDTARDEEGTFTLLNSSISKYTHSQFVDVYGPIPQVVWVNPGDAGKLCLKDGEVVEIFNDLGSIALRVEVTENISSGDLWAPRPVFGLCGNPLNTLVPGTPQKLGGGPVFNSVKVKLRRSSAYS